MEIKTRTADVFMQQMEVLHDLELGDLVEFKRGIISHWAVFVGEGKVVHISDVDEKGRNKLAGAHVSSINGMLDGKALVCEEDFLTVAGDSRACKNNFKDEIHRPYSSLEVVRRAKSKLGSMEYNILSKNCEHFVTWCRYGKEISDQATRGVLAAGLAFGAAAVTVGPWGLILAGAAWMFGRASAGGKSNDTRTSNYQ